MTKISPTIWPKTFLLQLYTDAVEQGCLRVSPITEDQAKSLSAAFYRFRRAADRTVAHFIQPEFQLCTVSKWTQHHNGSVYIIFSAMPEGQSLPTVTAVDPAEMRQIFAPPAPAEDPDLVIDTADINIDDYIQSLLVKPEND